jgi:hypothetical protein
MTPGITEPEMPAAEVATAAESAVESHLRPLLEERAAEHGFVVSGVLCFQATGEVGVAWRFEELGRRWACRVELPDTAVATLERVAAELTDKAIAWRATRQKHEKDQPE